MEPHDVGLRAVGEAAPWPAVGGRGRFWGGGPHAVRDQEGECVLCVCVRSPPHPLLLLLMGNGGFGATLALLTHPNLFFFDYLALDRSSLPPAPLLLSSVSLSRKMKT